MITAITQNLLDALIRQPVQLHSAYAHQPKTWFSRITTDLCNPKTDELLTLVFSDHAVHALGWFTQKQLLPLSNKLDIQNPKPTTFKPEQLEKPVQLAGTQFQTRVWRELLTIPAGTTTNYRTLGGKLGMRSGWQAVGAAVGANPVSVRIPCHRVVPKNLGSGGYRWGLHRKQALLALEADL